MTATNEQLLARYWEEVGRSDPRYLRSSSNYYVDGSGTLIYRRGRGDPNLGWDQAPIRQPMVVFNGDRHRNGTLVLNGDGFDDRWMQQMQATLRQQAQLLFPGRTAVIPFEALDGAQIERTTIKHIDITADTNFARPNILPVHRDRNPQEWIDWITTDSFPPGWAIHSTNREARDITYQGTTESGVRLRIRFLRNSRSDAWTVHGVHAWRQPLHGVWAWQGATWSDSHYIPQPEDLTGAEPGSYERGWAWTERIHQLGASVFTAVSRVDGGRHRYLSGFDMQEPGGLYFLAMLPARGPCKTYADALNLLAPPIVHKMREEGRNVYRQGDVFAIETTLTDEQVYDGAITRVRRAIAIQDSTALFVRGTRLDPPAEGEIRERGICPMCDCKPWVGNGPKARAALSIHGTGHTADEVVVKADGVTFIRGVMYHDPYIEDASRTAPDHRPLPMGVNEGTVAMPIVQQAKWCLAVRNTVPRLRPRALVTETDNLQLREHRQVEAENEHRREYALNAA